MHGIEGRDKVSKEYWNHALSEIVKGNKIFLSSCNLAYRQMAYTQGVEGGK